ncbi:MAG TPA: nuclear transport factor 2 family protein [Polyangia bacterium]|nr:nuclear transport factor 2 family protein [Polyangia bacterium]
MALFGSALTLIGLLVTTPAGSPTSPSAAATFAQRLAAAFAHRDPAAAGALFADDAVVTLVGERQEDRGRPQIVARIGARLTRYREPRLEVGRIWSGPDGDRGWSVVEFVFHARCLIGPVMDQAVAEHPVGVTGALVVEFNDRGLVQTLRQYLDEVSIIGQIDRALVPEAASRVFRPIPAAPPAGGEEIRAADTSAEASHLRVASGIWTALNAHQVGRAMAPTASGYVYDDFAGPAALDRAATRKLVARFLKAVPDIRFTSVLRFAAGDDVISENIEYATFNGKAVTLHALDVKRFRGTRVVREWQYANGAEVLGYLTGWAAAPLQVW